MKTAISFIVFALFLVSKSFSQHYGVPPERTDTTLILGTYNIQFFGERKHDLNHLARVIERFDICGIQEVKNPKAVKFLIDTLESLTKEDWGYVHGFPTYRPGGKYQETSAFVFRKSKVELGDGVISNVWDKDEKYRNDPFFCSFKAGHFDFSILQIHTRWSNDDYGSRAGEVEEIANQVEAFKENAWDEDVIVMGDFNYSANSKVIKAFCEELNLINVDPNPKTTFKKDNSDYASSYDHLFLDTKHTSEFVDSSSFAFDVTSFVYGDSSKESMKKSKSELSDHLPVYAVFRINGKDDD